MRGFFYGEILMKIRFFPIDELKTYDNNPRRIPEEAVKAVGNSIREFGFKVPVIIDNDNVIVAGHTRIMAARELGLKEIPCIVADDLTREQIKAFRLADNKTSELSGWDFEKLDKELAELEMDMSMFGFEVPDFSESYMDDLIDTMDGTGTDIESDYFSITFTINKEYHEEFERYIKIKGKASLMNVLIKEVSENA